MTLLDRVQIATGIPDWEPLSATEPNALFCVWADRRWRVERVGDRWEVEVRCWSEHRTFSGADLEQTLTDALASCGG